MGEVLEEVGEDEIYIDFRDFFVHCVCAICMNIAGHWFYFHGTFKVFFNINSFSVKHDL